MSADSRPFGFPFPPYDIQKDFMEALYNVLEQGKVGIFESPTGTVRKHIDLFFFYVSTRKFILLYRVNRSVSFVDR